jgi:FKBP-type peptidyl-prolyl cis-trans isomerase
MALLLAACGSDGDEASTDPTGVDGSTTTTVVNTDSLADVEISTDLSAAPTVTFDPSFALTEAASEVVVAGDGEPVQEGQRVTLDYVAISGATGEELQSTWGAQTESINVDANLAPTIRDVLVGQPIGSRVATANNDGVEWVILVMDIRDSVNVPSSAEGEAVTPPEGLPTVEVVEGIPTVTVPAGEPPVDLVVQPLIEGAGPVVEAGQTVTVKYVGLKWADGQIFDSSWERDASVDFPVGTGGVIPGFEEGLVGQTVGSRVMLVIPPEKGYGPDGNASAGIAGTDTLVFVVDILLAS